MNKKKGDPKLIRQIDKKAKKAPKKAPGRNPNGLTFADKKAEFESFILRGVSEHRAMDAIGMSRSTIDRYKERYPEYKERLKELKQRAKEEIGQEAKELMYDMVRTGITPVGELSSRDYRQALEYFTSHFIETKGDFTKTEHKITETIKEVPQETREKVQEVWEIEGAVDVEKVENTDSAPQIEKGEEEA
jgi:hypothetical protein